MLSISTKRRRMHMCQSWTQGDGDIFWILKAKPNSHLAITRRLSRRASCRRPRFRRRSKARRPSARRKFRTRRCEEGQLKKPCSGGEQGSTGMNESCTRAEPADLFPSQQHCCFTCYCRSGGVSKG